MNRKQRWGLCAAGLAILCAILFPPYYNMGGFIGGVCFGTLWKPLEWDYAIEFRPVLALDALLLQIGCFVSLTASYMIAVSKIGYDTVCMAWRGGLGALAGLLFVSLFVVGPHRMSPLGTPFLLSWYPAWFNPGYFLFWLRACGLSLLMTVIMILIVAVRRHRSPHTLTSQETMV